MTEKDYNPEQKQAKAMQKQSKAVKQKVAKAPVKTDDKKAEQKKTEAQKETQETKKEAKGENKTEKKPEKPAVKKSVAYVRRDNAPLSTKQCAAVCKFITGKKIEKAISDLEDVVRMRKAVPMKGEIPHRKGKGMMSGRYPKNASEYFIKLLKSLIANASVNGLENPVISEAVANIGVRPYGRFGAIRKKRTHLTIIAKDKSKLKNKTKKK